MASSMRKRIRDNDWYLVPRKHLKILYTFTLISYGITQDEEAEGEEIISLCDDYTKLCCSELKRDAILECQGYEIITTNLNCEEWGKNAEELCLIQCADSLSLCKDIGLQLKTMCTSMIRDDASPVEVSQMCEATTKNYEFVRCKYSRCQVDINTCASPQGRACAYCGNFQDCDCYSPVDNMYRNNCQGTTILEKGDEGALQSCARIPNECVTHKFNPVGNRPVGEIDGGCAPFRYCPQDLCVIKNVVCNPTNSCQKASTCIPETARCKPVFHPNSYMCDTGEYFTVPTTGYCHEGHCVGETDQCCKYGVQCTFKNPCLETRCDPRSANGCDCTSECIVPKEPPVRITATDTSDTEPPQTPVRDEYWFMKNLLPGKQVCEPKCDRNTGLCLIKPAPNGKPCSTGNNFVTREICHDGLCIGEEINLCKYNNIKCVNPPPACRDPGICDPLKGMCEYSYLPDGTPCNDGSKLTYDDMCVEGLCLGSYFNIAEYQHKGVGDCIDSSGRTVNRFEHRLPLSHDECRNACNWDVVCEGYSYGFFSHSCIFYSRYRTEESLHVNITEIFWNSHLESSARSRSSLSPSDWDLDDDTTEPETSEPDTIENTDPETETTEDANTEETAQRLLQLLEESEEKDPYTPGSSGGPGSPPQRPRDDTKKYMKEENDDTRGWDLDDEYNNSTMIDFDFDIVVENLKPTAYTFNGRWKLLPLLYKDADRLSTSRKDTIINNPGEPAINCYVKYGRGDGDPDIIDNAGARRFWSLFALFLLLFFLFLMFDNRRSIESSMRYYRTLNPRKLHRTSQIYKPSQPSMEMITDGIPTDDPATFTEGVAENNAPAITWGTPVNHTMISINGSNKGSNKSGKQFDQTSLSNKSRDQTSFSNFSSPGHQTDRSHVEEDLKIDDAD